MIPVLVCALITLSLADNDLDTLYPGLEHSRTIYVTGERWFMQSFFFLFLQNRDALWRPRLSEFR